MIQKTLSIILMTVMMMAVFAVPMALAEENTSTIDNTSSDTTAEPRLISANPTSETADDLNENESVSGLKLGWKQFGIWATFNAEKKAQKELELAKLQLIRAKIAAKNNNTEAMEKALAAHERIMDRVQAQVEKIRAKNESGDKFVGLNRAIQVHEDRITKISELLLNENLTDEKRAKLEERIAKLENVTSHLKAVEEKKTEIKEAKKEYKDLREEAKDRNMTVKEVADEKAKLIEENRKAKRANLTSKTDNDSNNFENESNSSENESD